MPGICTSLIPVVSRAPPPSRDRVEPRGTQPFRRALSRAGTRVGSCPQLLLRSGEARAAPGLRDRGELLDLRAGRQGLLPLDAEEGRHSPRHSTTRSARLRSSSGTRRPSAAAVPLLIARTSFSAPSTGSSWGLAPLRILATSPAAWIPSA